MNFFKSQFKPLTKKRILICLLVLVVAVSLFLSFSQAVLAQNTNTNSALPEKYEKNPFLSFGDTAWYYVILANTLLLIVKILGSLLLTIMEWVSFIFQYNGFLTSQAVTIGWPLVRDLVNMFFVVILLIIAFSTILKISAYQYKTTLLKLVLMAILVNFSKTILGFMIDFAQVIMLTFVNGFKEAMLINLSNAFGITNLINFREIKTGEKPITGGEVVIAAGLAVVILVIANFTMIAYLGVLVYRIITLWILVILSPIAFLSAAFPSLSKYASEFWTKFWDMLVVGVSCAFFMWLALTILSLAGTQSKQPLVKEFGYHPDSEFVQGAEKEEGIDISITQVSKSENLLTFVVAIFLLLMGLQYAQKAGGFGGAIAGAAVSRLTKIGTGALKAGGLPFKGAWKAAKFGYNEAADAMQGKGWVDINLKRAYAGIKEKRAIKKKRQYARGEIGAIKRMREGGFLPSRLAATAGIRDFYDEYGAWGSIGRGLGFKKFGKGATKEKNRLNIMAAKAHARAKAMGALEETGGSVDQYLEGRQPGLATERAVLTGQKDSLEEAGKHRALSKQEDADLTNIRAQLKGLETEELNLQAHIVIAGFETDGMNDNQLHDYYFSQQKSVTEEISVNEQSITKLKGKEDKTSEDERQISDLEERNRILGIRKKTIEEEAMPLAAAGNYQGLRGLITQKRGAVETKVKENLDKEIKSSETRLKGLEEKGGQVLTLAEAEERDAEIAELRRVRKAIEGDIARKRAAGQNVDADVAEAAKVGAKVESLGRDKNGLYHHVIKEEDLAGLNPKQRQEKIKEITKAREEKAQEEIIQESARLESLKVMKENSPHLTQVERKGLKEKVKASQDEANTFGIQAAEISTPTGFHAKEARRSIEAEEMKKVEGTESDTELISMFREAQARGNKARMAACVRKLANDYNDNEIFNAYGYASTSEGMRQFFDKEIGGKGGFSRQEELSLANDVGYINESRNHWNTARMTKMQKNGQWRWLSEQEHVHIVTVEIGKRGDREIASKLNRLAYGGEGADGKFMMTGLGAAILRQHAVGWVVNERTITEHMDMSVVQKLMLAEKDSQAITNALRGIKTSDGKDAAKELIRVFNKKLGATQETEEETAARVVQKDFGAAVPGAESIEGIETSAEPISLGGILHLAQPQEIQDFLNSPEFQGTQDQEGRQKVLAEWLEKKRISQSYAVPEIEARGLAPFSNESDQAYKTWDREQAVKILTQPLKPFNYSQDLSPAERIEVEETIKNINTTDTPELLRQEISNIVKFLREVVKPEQAGYLKIDLKSDDNRRFWEFREMLDKLRRSLEAVTESQGKTLDGLGRLGSRLAELDRGLPRDRQAKPKDVQKVLKALNVNETEISELARALKGIK